MNTEPKITFRGWPGHFICARDCLFRLNTLIEYRDIKIVVSTVGLYVEPLTKKFTQIGADRYFETMAFYAHFKDEFWDADVSREINFSSPWRYSQIEDENNANYGHYVVIEEICRRLKEGDNFESR